VTPRTRWLATFQFTALAAGFGAVPAMAQADTVRAGAHGSDSLQLVPGVDSTDTFIVRDTARVRIMTYVETVSETPEGYLIVGANVTPGGATVSLDSVLVERGTLAPRWHSDLTPAGRSRVSYVGDRMAGTAVDTAGAESSMEAAVAAGAFDYSMARLVINQLPLTLGYEGVLLTHDIRRGTIPVAFQVVGEETVTVGGRAADAWKVEMNYGAFTAERWIDRVTREDLRTRVVVNGREMLVEPSEAAP
jgi:hypothetical protein